MKVKKSVRKNNSVDLDQLRLWGKLSVKARLVWLSDAMRFAKFKKF